MNLNEKIKEIREIKQQLSKAYNEVTIEKFFDDYKDSEKPLFVYIQGYTPGFNDGDPCEHSVETTIGVDLGDLLEYSNVDSDLFSNFDLTVELFKHEYLFAKEPGNLREYIQVLLEELLYRKFGTDWQILIKCHNGIVEYRKSDYYCGY